MSIGEIARRCGVPRSTVSYALSGNRPVAEATRQRKRTLQRAGLEVPNQFSITGLVANRWAERCHTRVTAFDVPASSIAATAVRLLHERVTRPGTAPTHELLAPSIAMRESTGPAVPRR